MENLKQKIEGILFLYGEPITVKKLATITGTEKATVLEALQALKIELLVRGIRLITKDEAWQMVTAPEFSKIFEDLVKSEYSENLSRVALEVLSIVAYKGPLTRAEIEFIRGVNSVYSIRNLLMRGLIEKRDNPVDGRSHIYSVSFDFLRHFGFTELQQLPQYEDFHKIEVPNADAIQATNADAIKSTNLGKSTTL